MKPTEITMQIVKNLGNYETCRLEATFTLDEGDDLTDAFKSARQQLENAYETAYNLKKDNRKVLELNSKEFDRVCKALHEEKTDIDELQKFFKISDEIIRYFRENKLI
jgi:regulator of sigma D